MDKHERYAKQRERAMASLTKNLRPIIADWKAGLISGAEADLRARPFRYLYWVRMEDIAQHECPHLRDVPAVRRMSFFFAPF